MKRNRLLLAMASAMMASSVMAGEAVFYVTEDGEAVQDLAVSVDGKKKLVGKSGFVSFDVPAGSHTVELSQYGEFLGEFDFDTAAADQNAEIQVEMIGGEALPEINVFTPGQEAEVALGQISGYLESEDTGGAISGARISIAGTEQAVVTDEDGFFSFELARGEYDLVISDPNYGKRDVSGVRVMSNVNTGVNLNLSLEGEGVIEEVVAVGSYIPSSATAQQRDSSAVLNSIGSEQLSRFGDSSAASALKRVSGVSLVGGQFAVVRGLQGRYISSMLNGSLMPSTDSLRRDVPLDLFPASVLGGINIQKSYTPDMPGDTTGGSILMETKGLPDGPVSKLSVKLGLNTRTTFSDINGYKGGKQDYLGIDDGDRELPGIVDSATDFGQTPILHCDLNLPECTNKAEAAKLGQAFDHNYNVQQIEAKPERGFSYAFGDLLEKDFGDLGYYGAFQYSDKWEARHKAQTSDFGVAGDYERSKRKIDLTGYFVAGVEDESNKLMSKTVLLRKTDNTVKTSDTTDSNENTTDRSVLMQWVERQFIGQQLSGEHYFADAHQIDWRLGYSQTKRNEPDRRTYSYINDVLIPSTFERRYSELTESSIDVGVDYKFELDISDDITLTTKAGFLSSSKDRNVDLGRFSFNATSSSGIDFSRPVSEIINNANFANNKLELITRTSKTDSYKAKDSVLAYYLSSELEFGDFKVLAGARAEDSKQTLEYPNAETIDKDDLKSDDILPVLSATWSATEELQLRAGISKTISKPGLTERSRSVLYDPETDEQLFGNPDLVISEVTNVDVRAEYYFSEEESVSAAVFTKTVSDPIERTIPDSSGSAADGSTFRNEDKATLNGFEIDFRSEFELDTWSGFISGNATYIDAEVTLSDFSSRFEKVEKRKLQGQSEYLANLQFGLDHLESGNNITLLLNYFDDRIYKTARAQDPEVEKGRMTLDLVYQYDINDETSIKAKASNLTDEKVEFTRSGKTIESYYNGTGLSASLEMNF